MREPEAAVTAPAVQPRTERIRVEQHSAVGLLWLGGWLFTIGYLNLGFWKGLLAILLWPYYMGDNFAP